MAADSGFMSFSTVATIWIAVACERTSMAQAGGEEHFGTTCRDRRHRFAQHSGSASGRNRASAAATSALTEGLRASAAAVFSSRFESLSYQHRMHPQISEFPREMIYHGSSLRTPIRSRVATKSSAGILVALAPAESGADYKGSRVARENQDEVQIIAGLLLEFIAWAKRKGLQAERTQAVGSGLSVLLREARARFRASSKRLQRTILKTRFVVPDAPVEIVCGTVDRFQGRKPIL